MPLDRVLELIDDNTAGRALGILGEPGVNVLELNLALDEEQGVAEAESTATLALGPLASLTKLDPVSMFATR